MRVAQNFGAAGAVPCPGRPPSGEHWATVALGENAITAPPGARGYEEIAAAPDIPVETVGSRINRARKKLRKALGDVNPIGERRWTS
ncbi:hypothetical protein GCM10009734_29510 [Nonomuraea bangladeshensis]